MPDDLSYRSLEVRAPSTLNEEKRSLEIVIATETPVRMYDWETGEDVPEVLLAKGAIMPRQVPLLDTHSRWSVSDVLGSVRNRKVEGYQVTGMAFFSSTTKADEAFSKYREGHLTDFSVGYRFSKNSVTRVKKGEKVEIDGRTWKGPVNVVTSWTIKEVSCCPIGADAKAKARSDQPFEGGDQQTLNIQINNNSEIRKDTDMEREELEKALEKQRADFQDQIEALTRALQPVLEEKNEIKDIEQMRKDAIRAKENTAAKERARISAIDVAIEKVESAFGLDLAELRTELINSDTEEVDALRRINDALVAAKPSRDGVRVHVTKEERDKSRDAAVDGIMIRAGIAADKVGDKQTEYQTMSMLELAKDRLRIANQPVRGLDPMGIFQRALTTSDFSNIMSDVANKAMLEGFEAAEETYDTWADTSGRVNDFREQVFARASEAPSLVAINPDGGEYTYGVVTDAKESVTVVDYGIIVPFTRKLMVNDDLGALSDIREKLGAAARRKYGDLVYAVLTANAAMGDGTALFHADHSNFVDNGSGAVPSVATLNAGAAAMATQTDLQGVQNLNIRPQFILSPWALKGTVDSLLVSTNPTFAGGFTNDTATNYVTNPWSYLTPVYDARLDADDTAAWYLAARKGMTVKLFTLNGNMIPLLETREGWSVDGMEFKCRVTAAAKAMDWRGLYFNDGN